MRVLVTGATRNSGLSVIRALGRAGHRAIGADNRALPFGLRSRHSEPYRIYPRSGDPAFVEELAGVLRAAKPDAFLPLATWIVRAIVRERHAIEGLTGVNLPDAAAFEAVSDKRRLADLAAKTGVAVPELLTAVSARAALAGGGRVVIKPAHDRGGARGVRYCGDPERLDAEIAAVARLGEVAIQAFVPGPPDAMRTVTVVYGQSGHLLASFTTRKLRTVPASGGRTIVALSTHDPELVETLRPLFASIGWRGPAEAEFKIDAGDGRARLIEINPRFPAYVGFSVTCGLNLPVIAALAAAGRESDVPKMPRYAVGRRYVALAPLLAAMPGLFLRGGPGALPSIIGHARYGSLGHVSGWDDPLPRAGKLLHEIGTRLTGRRGELEEFEA